MIVEICANSFESAKAAQMGGAHRIELCENLAVGGVSPSHHLIKKVIDELDIPTHVLVRPRGGDFCYSEEELQEMLDTISYCKTLKCPGIVSGVLTSEGSIDERRTKTLIQAADGMEFTFHRAFDRVSDPLKSLQQLQKLQITRLLSSGLQQYAEAGIELLNQLRVFSEGKPEIMPGSGITSENVMLFKRTGFTCVHLSAIPKQNVIPNSLFETGVVGTSDVHEIRKVVQLAQ
ncbi:copper homeostasis protein CutC [Constantimarinum furrinae]|uniref:PF03932 family protein CutC n=1 Tax=Constantimarinum furrinae TaxID=2562285 RepID=A0A7G8PTB7_9FLAO|nr:copper homeostasis protein CutC [Constantimarinum furrinae]QNJ97583.1 copper homeostasis protein CutC [Constantimarinum furrinae]